MFSILIFGSDGNIFVWMESNLSYYLNGVFILKLWIFRKHMPVIKYSNKIHSIKYSNIINYNIINIIL